MTTPSTVSTTAAAPGAPLPEPEPARVPQRAEFRAAPLDETTWRQTLAFITPRADELKWASIPWQTDLWEARRIAAEQRKPIFAWMMNGNPLGCV
jgi:hypothetical protein